MFSRKVETGLTARIENKRNHDRAMKRNAEAMASTTRPSIRNNAAMLANINGFIMPY